jgi:hypothetical protein
MDKPLQMRESAQGQWDCRRIGTRGRTRPEAREGGRLTPEPLVSLKSPSKVLGCVLQGVVRMPKKSLSPKYNSGYQGSYSTSLFFFF